MPPAAKRCGQRCGQRCGHHVCSFTAAAPGGQRSRAWLAGVFAAAIQHRHVRDPELHAGVCSCPLRRPGLRGSAPGRSVTELHSRAFGLQTTPGGVRSGGRGCWLWLRSSGRGEEQDGGATAREREFLRSPPCKPPRVGNAGRSVLRGRRGVSFSSSRLPARPWELQGLGTPGEQRSHFRVFWKAPKSRGKTSLAARGTSRRRPGIPPCPEEAQSRWCTPAPRAEVSPTAASALKVPPSSSVSTSVPRQQGSVRGSADIQGLASCWRRRICKPVTQMQSDGLAATEGVSWFPSPARTLIN